MNTISAEVKGRVNDLVEYSNSFDLSTSEGWSDLASDFSPIRVGGEGPTAIDVVEDVKQTTASFVGGDSDVKAAIIVSVVVGLVSEILQKKKGSRAASRRAKRDAGIPTSQQFDSQTSSPAGRQ